MLSFELSGEPIDVPVWRERLLDPSSGGYASFEGWVRNLNEGEEVTALEYEAFAPLAGKEAERILGEAAGRFGVDHAACIHRVGTLPITRGRYFACSFCCTARFRIHGYQSCHCVLSPSPSIRLNWMR